MALSDYPPGNINWDTQLKPEMLQALGSLAVVSAQAEEMLHQIYWHHAGLDEKSGPIVTDNLNPKRLEEDVKKLVALDKRKANILADLKILLTEFEDLNTKRNHCLHWIWLGVAPSSPPPADVPPLLTSSLGSSIKATAYKLQRPVYRQKGVESQEFSLADVQGYCDSFAWLVYRLRSHTFNDDDLKKKREESAKLGMFITGRGTQMSMADLFWPAPWLDKPLAPDST
jgi:hypothetical protein